MKIMRDDTPVTKAMLDEGLAATRAEFNKGMAATRADFNKGIAATRADFTKKLDSNLAATKKELRAEITGGKDELRGEITEAKDELRAEMADMRQELKGDIDRSMGIVLEKMDDNTRLIMEILIPMKEKVDRIPKIEQDIEDIKQDLGIAKKAIKATNVQVTNHEQRITRLERKPA